MKMRVKTNVSITTTIPQDIAEQIDEAARELRIQKNDILVNAFTLWNKKRRQELLAESYKKMARDNDLIALADKDLSDWPKI